MVAHDNDQEVLLLQPSYNALESVCKTTDGVAYIDQSSFILYTAYNGSVSQMSWWYYVVSYSINTKSLGQYDLEMVIDAGAFDAYVVYQNVSLAFVADFVKNEASNPYNKEVYQRTLV
jgi:hypothetical protein